jgi:glutaconate CoA-transferase subunit B
VERLDFVTTPTAPVAVITDLGVLEPSESLGGELVLTRIHPGVTVEEAREATGWPLCVADDLRETDAPTDEERTALEELLAR